MNKCLHTVILISMFSLITMSCTPNKTKNVLQLENQSDIDSNYVLSDAFGVDDSLNSLLEEYRNEKNLKMNAVLSFSKKGFTKQRPSSNLTNLMADICLDYASSFKEKEVDFCLVNFGGIRSSLPKGKIKLEDAYKLMPFDNQLCVLEIHGDSVQSLIKYIGKRGGEPISGMNLVYENDQVKSVKISGKSFNNKKSYWMITSDYLANGGDRMKFLSNPLSRINLNVKYRDVIISYFKNHPVLESNEEKRIIYVN